MPTQQKASAAANPSPADILKRNRERAQRMAEQVGVEKIRKLLRRAQADLEQQLTKQSAMPEDSFTIQRLHVTMHQVRDVLKSLKGSMRSTLLEHGKGVAAQSSKDTLAFLDAAEKRFTGINQVLGLDHARVVDRAVAGTESSILARIEADPNHPGRPGVLDRYEGNTIQNFEEVLQQRLVTRKPWADVREELTQKSPFLKGAPGYWAERIVRTESMNASNKAGLETIKQAHEELGDMCKILSCTDDNRTGCLIGSTPVSSGVVWAVHRRTYKGRGARIRTKRGREFTATPNHPVLTLRGWVRADGLNEGDYLVCDGRQQYARPSREKDNAGHPSTFTQVFDALAEVGVFERRAGRQDDFHGDGMDGEVDVLRPYGELRLGCFAPVYKPRAKQIFTPSDDVLFCKCGRLLRASTSECRIGLRTRSQHDSMIDEAFRNERLRCADGLADALDRFTGRVSSDDLIGRDVRSEPMTDVLREVNPSRFRIGSTEAALAEQFVNEAPMRVQGCCHLVARHPAQIEFDRLVDIQITTIEGHVFNLSTEDGYFTADGVYVANSDSIACHGEIRKPDEPFESWNGSFQHPPDRPNDRASVVPHRVSWPIPSGLKPYPDGAITARWSKEGRKGTPPPRPRMTTIPLDKFGKPPPEDEAPEAKPQQTPTAAQAAPQQALREQGPPSPVPEAQALPAAPQRPARQTARQIASAARARLAALPRFGDRVETTLPSIPFNVPAQISPAQQAHLDSAILDIANGTRQPNQVRVDRVKSDIRMVRPAEVESAIQAGPPARGARDEHPILVRQGGVLQVVDERSAAVTTARQLEGRSTMQAHVVDLDRAERDLAQRARADRRRAREEQRAAKEAAKVATSTGKVAPKTKSVPVHIEMLAPDDAVKTWGVSSYAHDSSVRAAKEVFGSKVPTKASLERTWGFEDVGISVNLRSVQADGQGRVRATGYIMKDGQPIGDCTRSFRKHADGTLEVHHDYFVIDDEKNRSGGGGEAMLRQSIQAYEKMGVDKVTVDAAWIGRYAWATFGYQWDAHQARDVESRLTTHLTSNGIERERAKAIAKQAAPYPWAVAGLDLDGIMVHTRYSAGGNAGTKEGSFKIGKSFLLQGPMWSGEINLKDKKSPSYQRAKVRLGL
jgi:hypothetical protein